MLQLTEQSLLTMSSYLSEESHNRFSATEVTNKTLAAEMQELRARLAEAEETARTAERQKSQLQRQMQDFRRRLTPLHLEMQRIVEKVGWLKDGQFLWVKPQELQSGASLCGEAWETDSWLFLAVLVLHALGPQETQLL